jgi:hypothetical protein
MRKNTRLTWWRTSRRVRRCARAVRGVPQTKSPRRGPFLERERARDGEIEEAWVGFEKKERDCLTYVLTAPSHLHVPRAKSSRRTRGQSARCSDSPAPRRGRSVICTRTSSTASIAFKPHGLSAPHRETVRQVQPDSPAHWADSPSCLFFQLDIFRDKDLNMNLLGSLLKNNEGILPYDAM